MSDGFVRTPAPQQGSRQLRRIFRSGTRYVNPSGQRTRLRTVKAAIVCCVTAATVTAAGTASAGLSGPHHSQAMRAFFNPIVPNGADPWVVFSQGWYYLAMTTGNNVTIWKSRYLTDLGCAQSTVAWNPPAPYTDIWSPELQQSGRHWYIYFAADMNSNNVTHRIYVLRSLGRNPMGPYRFMGKLKGMADQWAIDPTVLHVADTPYLVWSGWLGLDNRIQRLFIARMASPLEVAGHATVISSPTFPWEQSVAPINEGPVALQRRGRTFIVFSADASWSNAYALGLLSLRGKNPMRATSWVKSRAPVFSSANGVFAPGHASFVKVGTQWWIVYHAAAFSGAGWDRNIFTQPFRWSSTDTPVFGAPRSPTSWIGLPEGTVARYTAQVQKTASGGAVAQISVPAPGTDCAWLHFSNISGGASMEFWTANGKPQLDLTFPSTGTSPSANLGTLITMVDLHAGTNILRFAESAPDASAQIRWVQVSRMNR